MHTTSLRKVGGSVMLTLPPDILDILDLSAGNEVEISIVKGRLVIGPAIKKQYKLQELLSNCLSTERSNGPNFLECKSNGQEIL